MDSTDIGQHGAWFNTTTGGHEAEFAELGVRTTRLKRVLMGLLTLVSFVVTCAA